MAIYYADSVNGNDANPGTAPGVGNAKATASAAIALASASGDVVEFAAGTYPLTANVTISNINGLTLRSAAGLANTAVEFTGAFQFAGSGAIRVRLINLTFKNYASSTAAITTNNSYAVLAYEDCNLDGASSVTSRAMTTSCTMSLQNCLIQNFDYVNAAVPGVVFENCKIRNIQGSNGVVVAVQMQCDFIGCEFYKCKWIIDLGNSNTTVQQDFNAFRYCTFDLKDGNGTGTNGYIYVYRSTVAATVQSFRFSNNIIYRTAKIIHNTGAGVLTIATSALTKNNWIQSGTNVANYNSSGGDITAQSDPLFYDASTFDYRLEPTSTAAVGNNSLSNTMGANELEAPTTFFTDPGVGNVNNGTTYKYNQRTGTNRTGTLSAGYPLLAQADVKSGVDRGNGTFGTYDPVTGNWEPVAAADLRSGVSKKQNGSTVNGLLNLPAIMDVKKDVSFDNATKTGTLESTDPGQNNVKSGVSYKIESVAKTGNRTDANPINVKSGTGTYGANGTELTPSYNPDFPAPANVLPNDTTNGVTGTADVDALANLPAESDVLELSGNYGKNLDKVPSLHIPETDDVLASELKIGVTKTIKDVDVTGTHDGSERFTDLPANKVADGYSYKYNTTGANNRTGTAGIEVPSTDPGEYNVLKDVAYVIDGVSKTGKYQPSDYQSTQDGFTREDILKEIENKLYNIRPSSNPALFQQVIKSVTMGNGSLPELLEADMPHVQVVADEWENNHRTLLFGGSRPVVKLRVNFRVTCAASYEPSDIERLIEDIEQSFMQENFNLNGKAVSVELKNSKILQREAGSESEVRKFELGLLVTYIRKI